MDVFRMIENLNEAIAREQEERERDDPEEGFQDCGCPVECEEHLSDCPGPESE